MWTLKKLPRSIESFEMDRATASRGADRALGATATLSMSAVHAGFMFRNAE
jgi:hypothetical protein